MRRKLIISVLIMITVSVIFCVSGNGLKNNGEKNDKINKDSYMELWKKVDGFREKGLPKSALKIINQIFEKSKKENNLGQIIKSLMKKFNVLQRVSENSLVKIQEILSKEIETSKAPLKQILHSIAAEQYWNYYRNNRYRFMRRSKVIKFKRNDMRTWDLSKLVEEVVKHYKKSLTDTAVLKLTEIDVLKTALIRGNYYRRFRPTVFDFLNNRAIDFFSNTQAGLIKPNDGFTLNKEAYLSNTDKFVKIKIKTNDNSAFKYYALKYLQDAVRFHYNDRNPSALVDIEIKRLKFVHSNGKIDNKDEVYLKRLNELTKKYGKYEISADVYYEIASYYNTQGNKYDPLYSNKYKFAKKKAVKICKKTITKYPLAKGSLNCDRLIKRIEKKYAELQFENTVLSNKPIISLLKYKNVDKLYYKIIRTNYDELKNWRYKNKGKLIKFMNKKRVEKENMIILPKDTDYQTHSLDVKFEGLKVGRYFILISNTKDYNLSNGFVATAFLNVSNIAYLHRTTEKGFSLRLFERNTGNEITRAEIGIFKEWYNNNIQKYELKLYKKYIITKEGGLLIPNNLINGERFSIEIKTKKERLFINREFYIYNYYDYHRTLTKTFFFTDRAIYRPGQTVYFKGIMIRHDNINGEKTKILKNYFSKTVFYDVNGQKIKELKLKSNEYGTFSGSFQIPTGLLNGRMRISNGYGNKYISVEEYKRPKFEVCFEKIKTGYRLNDEIKIAGYAKALAGYNIDNAKVRYRITRGNYYPYSWYYYRAQSILTEIGNGFTKTDKKGKFIIKFKASPDLSLRNDYGTAYAYTVSVDITDMNGETRSSKKVIRVGNRVLKLNIDIPSLLNKGEKKQEYKINSTNLSGETVNSSGNIYIYKLKSPNRIYKKKYWKRADKFLYSPDEYHKYFPNLAYSDENENSKLKIEKTVFKGNFDTKKDNTIRLKILKKLKSGKYKLVMTAKDKYNQEVKEIKYFTLYSKKEKKTPYKISDWFVNLKPTVEPGNNAEFLIGSSEKIVKIFFEKELRGKIIRRKLIKINNEQRLIKIPITEKYRGNISFSFLFFKKNRIYRHEVTITVPWSNKKLDISFETFRDKLLPGESEEWRLKIKGKKGGVFPTEMLAALYDASLDKIILNNWFFNPYPYNYLKNRWQGEEVFRVLKTNIYGKIMENYYSYSKTYDNFNWFGFYWRQYYRRIKRRLYSKAMPAPMTASKELNLQSEKEDAGDEVVLNLSKRDGHIKKKSGIIKRNIGDNKTQEVKIRKNLRETAFFFPHLKTNKEGEIIIAFKIPEALTRWKMLGFAHTKDLKYGFVEKELVTQKDLMVIPNPPRFLREDDSIVFTSKITNLTEESIRGKVKLLLFNSETMKPVDIDFGNNAREKSFSASKGESTLARWKLKIPEGIDALTWRVVARAGKFSDGEENILPILKNRILVTESIPLPMKPNEKRKFVFKKLINSKHSKSIKHHKLTLEFTSNPVWYAVQAIPYLMEYPYECLEQTFSRYYANKIASYIVKSIPEIQRVFKIWKNLKSSNELLSKLEKNQELKSLLLEETPWVRDAQNETESKRRIALLFDYNKMSWEQNRALKKLEDGQLSSGAWPWFKGMRGNRYITQYIVTGIAHLKALRVLADNDVIRLKRMVKKAIIWLDYRIKEDYDYLIEHKRDMSLNHLSNIHIHYLYARSYFKDLPIDDSCKKAFDYYKGLSKKYWHGYGKYSQGMIALLLHRYGDKATSIDIMKSIKEYSIVSDEMGMYWKETYGYNWYRAPIERTALLIEAFDEILKDEKSVSLLKTWLLKSKQTQNWKTTKSTVEAIYALLLKGDNWLKENKTPIIEVGSIKIQPDKSDNINVEAGTGYFKTSWTKSEIRPEMGNIIVKNRNNITAWGAVYWQYFENLDKITPAKTPLSLQKELFVEKYGKRGPVLIPVGKIDLKVGDRVKVRIVLRVDRDMEYVHLKDMRASGFEPENVISMYKWQDGLGYYETTKDASTNFFFDYLRKGTYVFEYPVRVTHRGDFSNGISSIQCMYAPEFTSHSRGVRVKIK